MLHDAFREDICTHPDEDGPRRIYADWLEDQGGPENLALAEYIRVQCQLVHTPTDLALRVRQAQLQHSHGADWLRALPKIEGITWGPFERGFVESIVVHKTASFLKFAEQLFRAAPILRLRFVRPQKEDLIKILTIPYLNWVRELDLMRESNSLPIQELSQCPFLELLTSLHLWNGEIQDQGAEFLANSENMPELTSLHLPGNNLHSRGAIALADAQHWPNLAELNLANNPINNDGALAFVQSAQRAGLRYLSFRHQHFSQATEASLIRRFGSAVVL